MALHITPFAPLFVALILGVLVWLTVGAKSSIRRTVVHKSCGSCGAVVFKDWRLCPECGEFIEGPPVAADSAAARGYVSDPDSKLLI